MENQNLESGAGQQTINIQVPSADNIASRRSLIPLLFAAVIIFFFFNFFTVSCGGQKIGSVTGINLVTGTELKDRDMFSGRETKGEKIPASAWAIIAFGAAIIGLGAFLIKEKREALIGTSAGAIGLGSLLILQFAIKSAIEKKAEGAIQTDFQFAYWGALIAIGIAGFISYLRMQKSHNIVVPITPPSPPAPIIAENITQTLASNNPIQQTNNFDIGEWFSKNNKIVISIVGIAIIVFGVYYFFIKHDPVKDAKNATSAFCDCSTKYNDAMIKANEEFIKSFDSYNFKKRQEARNKLQELQNAVNSENSNCNSVAQQKYSEKRNRYLADKELLEKFDFAFIAQSGSCNPANQGKHSTLSVEVENKISSIKDPPPPPPTDENNSSNTNATNNITESTASLTIFINTDGKVSLGIASQITRASLLKKMAEIHRLNFTPKEIEAFSQVQSFGVPMNNLKLYLNTYPSDRIKYFTGVPIESEDNQLSLWIRFAILDNPNMAITIKTNKGAPNTVINEVIKIVKNDGMVKSYNLITE